MLLHPGHGLYGVHVGEKLSEDPDTVVGICIIEEVVPTCRGKDQIDGREDSLVGEVAVQLEFHVAGALEFLKDNVVHLGTGFSESGGKDGKRAAAFDITGSTEEALGLLEGVGVHTAGENLTGSRLNGVIGACKTGYGVQEDNYVVAAFNKPAGLIQHHIGNLDVAFCGFIEGGGNNLGLDASLHVRNFLRALINEEHNLIDLRVVIGNGVGNSLQEHGLTGFGLSHNEAALALADGREHIHNPDALVFLMAVAQEIEFLRGEQGSKEVKRHPVADKFRGTAVYELDAYKREIFVSLTWRTDFAGDGVSVLEGVLLDLLLGDVDIVRGVQVIIVGPSNSILLGFSGCLGCSGCFFS